MKKLITFRDAVTAGIMIGIGGAVFLSCESKVLGAVLFSIGLFTICAFKLNLFTGKIGYVTENKNDPDCIVIWLGNLTGCCIDAVLLRLAKPQLHEAAVAMAEKKLEMNLFSALILGIFCGIIMYVAVVNFKNNTADVGKYIGIFVGVPTFILCGFEHSIADMFYCAMGISSFADAGRIILFLLAVTVGNCIGGIGFRYLVRNIGKK